MRGNGISRAMGIAVAALSLAVDGVCGQPANAETAYCWTNSATGASVPSSDLAPIGSKVDPLDPNHATHQSNPKSSTYFPANVTTTYVRGSDGGWNNTATGTPVPNADVAPIRSKVHPPDPNHDSHQSDPQAPTYFSANPTNHSLPGPCLATTTTLTTNR